MDGWQCCGYLDHSPKKKSLACSKRQDDAWDGCMTRDSTCDHAASFARDLCARCCRNQRASKSVKSRHSAKCSSANPEQTCGSGKPGTLAVFRGSEPRLLRRASTLAPHSQLCLMALCAGTGAPGECGRSLTDAHLPWCLSSRAAVSPPRPPVKVSRSDPARPPSRSSIPDSRPQDFHADVSSTRCPESAGCWARAEAARRAPPASAWHRVF